MAQNYFDNVDDYTIKKICRKLIKKEDFTALSHLIQSSKRFYNVCQSQLHDHMRYYVLLEDDPEQDFPRNITYWSHINSD